MVNNVIKYPRMYFFLLFNLKCNIALKIENSVITNNQQNNLKKTLIFIGHQGKNCLKIAHFLKILEHNCNVVHF